MNFGKDLEKAVVAAARDGAKDLTLKNARAAKAGMGSRGTGITFSWQSATGGKIDQLGSLNVRGPSDDVVQEFQALLRKRMGQ